MKRHWLVTGLLLSILVAGNSWAKYQENPDAVFKAFHADDSTINHVVIDELKLSQDLSANGQYSEGLRWERDVPGNNKVLAIDTFSDTDYLFWRREGKGWKYLGSHYYDLQILGQPIVKTIITPDNRDFLRIIYYQDEGTGIYRQGENWFDLSGDKLKKILTFSTHGVLGILGNYYEIKFKRSSLKLNEGDLHLVLHYKGYYRLCYEEKEYPEIEFSRDLFYVLPKGKRKFVLDKKLNKWKKSEIRDMYDPYIGDFINLFPEEMKELKKQNDPEINKTIEVIERWKDDSK